MLILNLKMGKGIALFLFIDCVFMFSSLESNLKYLKKRTKPNKTRKELKSKWNWQTQQNLKWNRIKCKQIKNMGFVSVYFVCFFWERYLGEP